MENENKVQETKVVEKEAPKKEIIAFRKACDATGTGLSHYILMDRKER